MLDAVIMGVELARAATGAAIGDLVDYHRRTDDHKAASRVVAASVAVAAAIDDLVADLRRQANQ